MYLTGKNVVLRTYVRILYPDRRIEFDSAMYLIHVQHELLHMYYFIANEFFPLL